MTTLWIRKGVVTLLWLSIAYGAWLWFSCRFYVSLNEMAVIVAKTGEPLAPGQILAQPGQQGVQAAVLGEGRYFYNPWLYEWQRFPVMSIEPGKVGIVTAMVGSDLPTGEFLANEGQKGIQRRVLGPGKYRLNPYGYRVEVISALSIPVGYVGVVTGLSGGQAPEGEFAGSQQKGVRQDILQPGLYYINPKEFNVDVVEIGVNQVSLLGKSGGEVITKTQIAAQNAPMQALQNRVLEEQKEKRRDYLTQREGSVISQSADAAKSIFAEKSALAAKADRTAAPTAKKTKPTMPRAVASEMPSDPAAVLSLHQMVEFPSRDGFEISLDMTVEFELSPGSIAWIFRTYGDLPAVVDKIIMPQILSVSRLKGSAYRAKDFIVGEGREKFQNDLTETLAKTLVDRRILIHNALIRHVNVPNEILDPIQQASIAVEENLTNKEKQNTARKQAELNTELGLIAQRRQQVAQETRKLAAEIQADQEKQVAQILAEAIRQMAEIDKQTALQSAERVRKLGQARAETLAMVEGEKAAGLQLKIQALGDASAYILWDFAQSLSDTLRIHLIPTGPGTLWTDLDQAGLAVLGGGAALRSRTESASSPVTGNLQGGRTNP
ncbi:MAG: SPFH domain-containing protein [Pseudomonadota bacterium]